MEESRFGKDYSIRPALNESEVIIKAVDQKIVSFH